VSEPYTPRKFAARRPNYRVASGRPLELGTTTTEASRTLYRSKETFPNTVVPLELTSSFDRLDRYDR